MIFGQLNYDQIYIQLFSLFISFYISLISYALLRYLKNQFRFPFGRQIRSQRIQFQINFILLIIDHQFYCKTFLKLFILFNYYPKNNSKYQIKLKRNSKDYLLRVIQLQFICLLLLRLKCPIQCFHNLLFHIIKYFSFISIF